ncbi:MAG: zinc-ribbon domain-containing protein [Microcella sp.]|uniref:zinc-ribbon domain-containing protein n=1 Tax=Microcella sp. TaxID=1913979 RepID=UPI002719421B|nr:zinc-ribbon domain-containing protein [Microcella sp.]MDO8338782.1 zinc-ribbon domain-containing protein [Microcella sp.]
MICQHCGATLPPIAMFCGECGRSVAARGPVVPPVTLSSAAMPFSASEPLSITPATPPEPDDPSLARPEAQAASAPPVAVSPSPVPGIEPVVPPAARPADEPRLASALRPAPGGCPRCGTLPEPDDVYCGTCGEPLMSARPVAEETIASPPSAIAPASSAASSPAPAPAPAPAPTAVPAPSSAPAPAVAPAPPPAVAVSSPAESSLEPDTENTRLVPRGSTGARFVLQFSTGESYTVLGSGIIGRNPSPEPGEAVDHIVTIVDPGRSVSKSHLEFGQDNGVFWVSDRHSGNGSVIREPGSEPRYCEPGRRYRVVRGTRIDIGEQFVVVS